MKKKNRKPGQRKITIFGYDVFIVKKNVYHLVKFGGKRKGKK
jgi:hypothetical protein